MRRLLPAVVLVACLALPPAVSAVSTTIYKGRATSTDRDFKYGPVTVKRRGARVTHIKIESVTTTGCGGFMNVIFAPSNSETQITKGSARIRDGLLSVTYRSVRSIEDQTTTIRARFSGSRVTGTFKSGDLCVNEGRFRASR